MLCHRRAARGAACRPKHGRADSMSCRYPGFPFTREHWQSLCEGDLSIRISKICNNTELSKHAIGDGPVRAKRAQQAWGNGAGGPRPVFPGFRGLGSRLPWFRSLEPSSFAEAEELVMDEAILDVVELVDVIHNCLTLILHKMLDKGISADGNSEANAAVNH